MYATCTLCIFLVSALMGYFFPSSEVVKATASLKLYTQLEPLTRSFTIFINNMFVASLILVSSIVVIPAFYIIVVNGYILGSLVSFASQSIPVQLIVTQLLPHGVLELMAYSYSLGTGLAVLETLLRRTCSLPEATASMLRAYSYAVYILLLAAFIESYFIIGSG